MSGWSQRFTNRLPNLSRDERKELLERVAVGARGDSDFHVMMVLSSGLASLGLLEGSTAVSIEI